MDQGLILEYYKDRLELLPDEFNWKGYMSCPHTLTTDWTGFTDEWDLAWL